MTANGESVGLVELACWGTLGAGVAIDPENVVPARGVGDDGGGGPRRFAAAAGRRRSAGTREGVDGIPNTVHPIQISLFYFFFYKIYLATKFWGGMRPYIIHI